MAAEAVGANTAQLSRGSSNAGRRGTIGDVLVLAAPSGRIRRSGVELQAPFAVCA
jgi:hypothetical protein